MHSIQRDFFKYKKELSEERDSRSQSDRELRELRQNVQGKREADSAEQGKRRLDFENLRVELRRKSEQLEKQRESYEERINMMNKRIEEMEESMGQKQMLSRLLQHHSQ